MAKQIVNQQARVMTTLTKYTEIMDVGTVLPALRTSSEMWAACEGISMLVESGCSLSYRVSTTHHVDGTQLANKRGEACR